MSNAVWHHGDKELWPFQSIALSAGIWRVPRSLGDHLKAVWRSPRTTKGIPRQQKSLIRAVASSGFYNGYHSWTCNSPLDHPSACLATALVAQVIRWLNKSSRPNPISSKSFRMPSSSSLPQQPSHPCHVWCHCISAMCASLRVHTT